MTLPARGGAARQNPPRIGGGQTSLPPIPRYALIVVLLTLAGFVVTSFAGVNPAWAALGGAVLLAGRGLARRTETPAGVARAIGVEFLLFVLGLGVVVESVVRNGLGAALTRIIPGGSSLLTLLALAGLAALLANVVNNLPAVLVLLSVLRAAGLLASPGPVLAVLIGVNVGPNLTYAGSLATLLWRRLLAERDHRTRTWASSPGSACSPCRPGWRWPRWRYGRRCGCELAAGRASPGPAAGAPATSRVNSSSSRPAASARW